VKRLVFRRDRQIRSRAAATRHAYYTRPLDLPSVALVVAGLALWLVWPSPGDAPDRARLPRRFEVCYAGSASGQDRQYREPTIFFDPLTPMREVPSEGFTEMIGAARKRRSRLLPRERSTAGDGGGEEDLAPLRLTVENVLAGYVPQWEKNPVFLRREGQDPRLVVRCSEALRQAGFQPPELTGSELANGKAWEVILSVDWEDGETVRHVFLERGSGDPAVDSAAVRTMYKAALREGAGARSGRVTLSYGKQ